MIEMIISAFIVGFMVAIPPGAVTVVAAQKSILHGFKSSLYFTIGSCLSDIFYILVVFFGVAPLINNSIPFKIAFWFLSSLLLFYFGFDSFRALRENIAFSNHPRPQSLLRKDIFSGIGITLSNPMTIAGWVVIAGGFFTHWKTHWPPINHYGLFSIVVMMIGVLCWFVPLIFIISRSKRFISNRFLKVFVMLSGFFFIAVGFYSIFSALQLVL
jgi:threonine/homoserine/homoserine lactone efflux protein